MGRKKPHFLVKLCQSVAQAGDLSKLLFFIDIFFHAFLKLVIDEDVALHVGEVDGFIGHQELIDELVDVSNRTESDGLRKELVVAFRLDA